MQKIEKLEAKVLEQKVQLKTCSQQKEPKDHVSSMSSEDTVVPLQNVIPRSCHEARLADPSLTSGMYWIDPDGQGVGDSPVSVHCDMVSGIILCF